MKIKDLKEGLTIKVRALVEKTESDTGKRGPYTRVYFTDGEQHTSGNAWVPISEFPYSGKVVDMDVTMNSGYINIKKAVPCPDALITDFVPHAPIDTEACMRMIYRVIDQMTDEPEIQLITKTLISENEENFKTWSAAKSVHHNYIGGLLYHTCRMLTTAKGMAHIYKCNESLLAAGVILHDIGKLKELATDQFGNATYTVSGNLFGHLFLGAEMVGDVCRRFGIDVNKEPVMLLRHMIISHHGKLEFGAIKLPAVKEAYVLSVLDAMDANACQMEEQDKSLEPGSCSAPVKTLSGSVVYKKNVHTSETLSNGYEDAFRMPSAK